MGSVETLPLFPLHAVLLPGAALALRVFERRYLDLVRDCGRGGHGFGISLILEGQEAGQPATPAAFGTEALIEDFDVGKDGLLALRVRGARRFQVLRTRVRDNGLVVGDIRWCAPDPDDELRPQHALLATLLQTMLEKIDGDLAQVTPAQWDNAAWIGWRLGELLPISPEQRVALLQEDDPHARLDRLLAAIA